MRVQAGRELSLCAGEAVLLALHQDVVESHRAVVLRTHHSRLSRNRSNDVWRQQGTLCCDSDMLKMSVITSATDHLLF